MAHTSLKFKNGAESLEVFMNVIHSLQEEIHERPQITSMIGSLANYSNTIPSAPSGDAADGDAKPAAPSARMGKFKITGILAHSLRANLL